MRLGSAKKGYSAISLTNNFTGAVSSAWNTAGNWSLGVVPTSTQDIVILANCTLNTSPTVRKLTVASGITLTFGTTIRTLTINSDFNCLGTVDMQSNTHTLSLFGIYNTCNSLVTDSNNSTVSYAKTNTTSVGQQIFASANYRNLTVVFKANITNAAGQETIITGGSSITVANTLNSTSGFLLTNGQTIIINGTGTHTIAQHTIAEGGNIIFSNTCSLSVTNTTRVYGKITIGSSATLTCSVSAGITLEFYKYAEVIGTNVSSTFKTTTTAGGTFIIGMENAVTQFCNGSTVDFTATQPISYQKNTYAGGTSWGGNLKIIATTYGGSLIPSNNSELVGVTTCNVLTATAILDTVSYSLTVNTTSTISGVTGSGFIRCIGLATLSAGTVNALLYFRAGVTINATKTMTSATFRFETNSQNLTNSATNTIGNVYVDGITVTKQGASALTISSIDGASAGTSTFNRSGTATVTTNLGGVTVI